MHSTRKVNCCCFRLACSFHQDAEIETVGFYCRPYKNGNPAHRIPPHCALRPPTAQRPPAPAHRHTNCPTLTTPNHRTSVLRAKNQPNGRTGFGTLVVARHATTLGHLTPHRARSGAPVRCWGVQSGFLEKELAPALPKEIATSHTSHIADNSRQRVYSSTYPTQKMLQYTCH